MEIIDRIQRKIEHDHVIDLRNVQSPRRNIRTYQNRRIVLQFPFAYLPKPLQIVLPDIRFQIPVITQRRHTRLGQGMFRGPTRWDGIAEYQRQRHSPSVAVVPSALFPRSLSAGHDVHQQTQLIRAPHVDEYLFQPRHHLVQSRRRQHPHVLRQGDLHEIPVVAIPFPLPLLLRPLQRLLPKHPLGHELLPRPLQQLPHRLRHRRRRQNDLRRPVHQRDLPLLPLLLLHFSLPIQHGMQQPSQIVLKPLLQHGIHLVDHHVPHAPQKQFSGVDVLSYPSRSSHHDVDGFGGEAFALRAVIVSSDQEEGGYFGAVGEGFEDREDLAGEFPGGGQEEGAGAAGTAECGEGFFSLSLKLGRRRCGECGILLLRRRRRRSRNRSTPTRSIDVRLPRRRSHLHRHHLLRLERLHDGKQITQRLSAPRRRRERHASRGRNGRVPPSLSLRTGHAIPAPRQNLRNRHGLHGGRTGRESRSSFRYGGAERFDQFGEEAEFAPFEVARGELVAVLFVFAVVAVGDGKGIVVGVARGGEGKTGLADGSFGGRGGGSGGIGKGRRRRGGGRPFPVEIVVVVEAIVIASVPRRRHAQRTGRWKTDRGRRSRRKGPPSLGRESRQRRMRLMWMRGKGHRMKNATSVRTIPSAARPRPRTPPDRGR
mmetsp:Transcript_4666/g.10030  ORF Transcript_4666/g.10030 Transcript_4666/m.10030 type:complete len:652 (+) Transcript_4666:523-2478(+)